jgi:hypothetical protein
MPGRGFIGASKSLGWHACRRSFRRLGSVVAVPWRQFANYFQLGNPTSTARKPSLSSSPAPDKTPRGFRPL